MSSNLHDSVPAASFNAEQPRSVLSVTYWLWSLFPILYLWPGHGTANKWLCLVLNVRVCSGSALGLYVYFFALLLVAKHETHLICQEEMAEMNRQRSD